MNKNSNLFQKRTTSRMSTPLHPVWRGIGFILLILLPALGYSGAITLLNLNSTNHWFPIPPEFLIYKWGLEPLILVKIGLTLIISFLLYTIFLSITFLLNGIFAPKRYIPPDLPPIKRKKRNEWFF